ncbi:response regulator [Paenibacillus piri]|uniref:Transcriptional regulatory protein n=1 Tax=Paenibacillus piri TaxID=2547395 RepID=A0A4R5KI09_9BACL|nr:response regulator [Paenibacillus piri]TDF95139.1 response regulator [Paenibacillus piri]
MKSVQLRALVVDDDFMIARVHASYIEQQEGYELAGVAGSFEQTIDQARKLKPDLLILDVYLPDRSGIDVLRTLRSEKISCDVILITAAKEIGTIEEAFQLGIFDYLIKPFDLDLLQDTLKKYRQFKIHLQSPATPDQQFVEGLKKFRSAKSINLQQPQKGIDLRTLERIKQSMALEDQPCSAERIAHMAGVSRSTARAYLEYLIEQGTANEFLQYGTVGRPQRLFCLK